MALTGPRLARQLEELIAALDRRRPHGEPGVEIDIARDAAALRTAAVDRLAAPDLADGGADPLS